MWLRCSSTQHGRRALSAERIEQDRTARFRSWYLWVKDAWTMTQHKLCRCARGEARLTALMLLRPDGSATADAMEMDQLLRTV